MANYGKYYIAIRLLLLKQYLEANAGRTRIVKRSELEDLLAEHDMPVQSSKFITNNERGKDFLKVSLDCSGNPILRFLVRPHPFTKNGEKECGLTFARKQRKTLKLKEFQGFGAASQI